MAGNHDLSMVSKALQNRLSIGSPVHCVEGRNTDTSGQECLVVLRGQHLMHCSHLFNGGWASPFLAELPADFSRSRDRRKYYVYGPLHHEEERAEDPKDVGEADQEKSPKGRIGEDIGDLRRAHLVRDDKQRQTNDAGIDQEPQPAAHEALPGFLRNC